MSVELVSNRPAVYLSREPRKGLNNSRDDVYKTPLATRIRFPGSELWTEREARTGQSAMPCRREGLELQEGNGHLSSGSGVGRTLNSVLPATGRSLKPAKPWSGLAGPSQAQAGCAAGFWLRLEISQAYNPSNALHRVNLKPSQIHSRKKSPKPPAKPEPGPSRPGYPAQAPAWEFQRDHDAHLIKKFGTRGNIFRHGSHQISVQPTMI
ncbi:hypothetical protein FB45DRAFT_881202 [Roridomyces roridus]|uniref:Uncharacterized protein n=1 Tax=Roridomyces roridus TaxID=1738132 RepID=A0AAD7AYH7_9AGAR|nr:hypothetical protein FB45DRAFT_881202 [Roridomyces roridus]